jgi:hypothetical protein
MKRYAQYNLFPDVRLSSMRVIKVMNEIKRTEKFHRDELTQTITSRARREST